MKTLRFLGFAIVAILMCVTFTACGSDDDGNGGTIVGTWTRYYNDGSTVDSQFVITGTETSGKLVWNEPEPIGSGQWRNHYSYYRYTIKGSILELTEVDQYSGEDLGYETEVFEIVTLTSNSLVLRKKREYVSEGEDPYKTYTFSKK